MSPFGSFLIIASLIELKICLKASVGIFRLIILLHILIDSLS